MIWDTQQLIPQERVHWHTEEDQANHQYNWDSPTRRETLSCLQPRKTGHRNELISTPHCDQQLIGGATTCQQLSLVGITQNRWWSKLELTAHKIKLS